MANITNNSYVINEDVLIDMLLCAYHNGHHATLECCFVDDDDPENVKDIISDFISDALIEKKIK